MEFIRKVWGSVWVFALYVVCVIVSLVSFILLVSDPTFIGDAPVPRIQMLLYCWVAIILFHLGMIIRLGFKRRVPLYMELYYIFIVLSHFVLGSTLRLFDQGWHFDKILHTASGAVVAGIGITLALAKTKGLKRGHMLLFAFCFSMMVAVMWEFAEFGIDAIFRTNMQRWQDDPYQTVFGTPMGSGLIDTMMDMITHAIGALVVVVGYVIYKKRQEKKLLPISQDVELPVVDDPE